MRSLATLLMLSIAACGQLAFEQLDAGPPDGSSDDARIDARPDASPDAPMDGSVDGLRDAGVDAGPPLDALYVSPTGDDANPGTREAPFRTLSFAVSRLDAGDTLLLFPGTYAESTGTGLLDVDCSPTGTSCEGAPCNNGTALEPIVIRSANERAAVFRAELGDPDSMVLIRACENYVLEGFTLVGADIDGNPWHSMAVIESRSITARRHLFSGNNRFTNSHLFLVDGSQNVLVEENEFYDFNRVGLAFYRSQEVTARRNYVNARGHADIPGGRVSGYPTSGDAAYTCSHSASCLFENNVSFGDLDDAFDLSSSQALPDGASGAGDDASFLGNIVSASLYGIFGVSSCNSMPDCDSIDERNVRNVTVRDNVILDTTATGIFFRGAANVLIERNSLFDAPMRVDVLSSNSTLSASVSIFDNLVQTTDSSIVVQDVPTWEVAGNDTFPGDISTNGVGTLGTNTQFDPQLDGCVHRIPTTSPLAGAGRAGGNVGASIVNRYVDGVLTDERLWNADGSFPCGAVVAGINDAGDTCRTFDELGVVERCPIE